MCNFFSCIATRDGRLLFSEDDSHEVIVNRANLRDNDAHIQHFVRLEIVPPFDKVHVDEQSIPAWYASQRVGIEERAKALARRVQKAVDLIDTIRAKADAEIAPIWAKAHAETAPIRAKAHAEIDTIWKSIEGYCAEIE
jgi:hypothetical protein